jgi:hypothetical protein
MTILCNCWQVPIIKKKEWALGENDNVDCDLTDEQIVQETLNNNHEDDENECE